MLSNSCAHKFFCHNGSKYDFLIILRGLIQMSQLYFEQKLSNGKSVMRPFLYGKPKILFKNTETPLSIKFRFTCPNTTCKRCCLTTKQKQELLQTNNKLPLCAYQRNIIFIDSLSQLSFSLGKLVDDLWCCSKANERQKTFKTTHDLMTNLGYNQEQFELVITQKLQMPFEAIKSLNYLLSTKRVPPKQDFKSVLKGEQEISDHDYETFKNIWESLNISNLFEIFVLYLKLDTTLLADVLLHHYNALFEVTGLYLYHFLTIASYSLASILKNTIDPIQKNRSLQLQVLNKDCYDIFKKILVSFFFFIIMKI